MSYIFKQGNLIVCKLQPKKAAWKNMWQPHPSIPQDDDILKADFLQSVK